MMPAETADTMILEKARAEQQTRAEEEKAKKFNPYDKRIKGQEPTSNIDFVSCKVRWDLKVIY